MDLFKQFLSENRILQNLESDATVIVAVSGGCDSIALLHLFNRFSDAHKAINLVAAHFNHRLRPEAEDEQQFVGDFCSKLGVELFIGSESVAEIAKRTKRSEHDIGRELRYDFLIETAARIEKKLKCENKSRNKNDLPVIATAHHKDDQIETILMRLFMGGGLEGLSGIKADKLWETSPPVRVARPLLTFRKKQLIEYCLRRNLNYMQDLSNFDLKYPRNAIRHKIIPQIEEFLGAKAFDGIERSVEHIRNAHEYIMVQTEIAFNNTTLHKKENEIVLDYQKFHSYLVSLRYNIILKSIYLINNRTVRISFQKLKEAVEHLASRKYGIIELGFGFFISAIKQSIWIYRIPAPVPDMNISQPGIYKIVDWGTLTIEIVKAEMCSIPPDKNSLYVNYDLWKESEIRLEAAKTGDSFQPYGMKGRKLISDFLNEMGIPIHRRSYPVIKKGGEIMAVPPFRIADRFKLTDDAKYAVVMKWREDGG